MGDRAQHRCVWDHCRGAPNGLRRERKESPGGFRVNYEKGTFCMDLRDYIRVARRNWVLIVLFALMGTATGAAFTLTQTPEYTATSKVFVSTSSSQNVADLAQGNNFTVQRVK